MMNKLKYMEINGNISLFLCISICYILLKLNNIEIYRTIIKGTLKKILSRKSAITDRIMICKTLFLKATLIEK